MIAAKQSKRVQSAKPARLERWFAKRAPRADSAHLNLRNVYIFFSREGALFALLMLITFVAGINYANNLVLGLCFYLASVWVISFHLTFAHVMGLKVELLEVTMAEVGQPAWATIKIISHSGKPRRQLNFRFDNKGQAPHQHPVENKVRVTKVAGEHIIRLPILSEQRGKLILPRLIISTVYPLGIMRAWSYVYFATPAWFYPSPLAFDWQDSYVSASEMSAAHSLFTTQGQDDFDQLDDYIEGESLARVSWAHVARGQGMLSKHFSDPVGHELRLDYKDMPAAQHEQKLAQLVFALQNTLATDRALQLVLPNDVKGEFGQGHAFIQASLLRIAKVP
ncbi:DUF58 domain-containing protein [Psychrobacter arenosus]|uniref:DUF58 domain-containing protein n=1 Tax=Psychrobacter arenosus TaxID=256326 RepID=UPI001918D8D6|nr:DUF58 domain-containing protein [Psychrobacter arenosus]